MVTPRKGYVSLNETMSRFMVTRKTIYNWRKKKKLDFICPGGKEIFFKLSDLDKLWEKKDGH